MGRKMVPNQPLNGNTVGGSGSFKARPGHIVLPDRRRRMEFAGGCQKVSILCERPDPLFTALYRAQAPFVLLLLSPLASPFFTSLRRIRARRPLPSQPPPHPYAPQQGRRVGTHDSLLPPFLTSLPIPPLSERTVERRVPEATTGSEKGDLWRGSVETATQPASFLLNHPSHTIKTSARNIYKGAIKNKSTGTARQEVGEIQGMQQQKMPLILHGKSQ